MFDQHYSELSSRDHGTLYQMKTHLSKIGRGVKKSVKDAVNDCGEFLRIVTKIYVVLAANHLLDIHDPDSSPTPCPSFNNKEERTKYFDEFALTIIDNYVLRDYDPEKILTKKQSNLEEDTNEGRVACGYPECPKTFAVDGLVRQRHRRTCLYKDLVSLEDSSGNNCICKM